MSTFPRQTSHELLVALSGPHAYGWRSDGEAQLHVVARRRNVSVEIGRFPGDAAASLVDATLAAWEPPAPSGRQRLVLTEQGRRNAAFAAAGAIEPARALQGDVDVRADASGVLRLVDEAESPLAWLARRRGKDGRPLIDPAGFEAGERLRRDMTLAQTLPSVTSRWDGMPAAPSGSPSPGHVGDLILAARQRVERALDAAGPEFSGLLVDVCGFLKGLERIETERRWPRSTARVVLDLALSRLARHYGLGTSARGPDRSALRHWGAVGYRPEIES